MPLISVILPVYNGEPFVEKAVQSILDQTCKDFELILVNDASVDSSLAIIKSFTDPRIRVVSNEINRGLSTSLNTALDLARGDFIARMDQDDVSVQDRLFQQLSFFSNNPSIDVCGSWVQTFGAGSRLMKYPCKTADIKASFLFGNVICHPTVMFRSKIISTHGFRYSPEFEFAEDFDFWTQMLEKVSYANIPRNLLNYRLHPQQMTSKSMNKHELAATKIFPRLISKLGIIPTDRELELHCAIGFNDNNEIIRSIDAVEKWLLKLHSANKTVRFFSEDAFNRVLVKRWLQSSAACRRAGVPILSKFWKSPLVSLAGNSTRVASYFNLLSRRRR